MKNQKKSFILKHCEKLKGINEVLRKDPGADLQCFFSLRKQIYQLLNQLVNGLSSIKTTGVFYNYYKKPDDLIRKEMENKQPNVLCDENAQILAEMEDKIDECLNEYFINFKVVQQNQVLKVNCLYLNHWKVYQ